MLRKVGLLCCHASKVLDVMDIKSIPKRYVIKKWSRDTKDRTIEEANMYEIQGNVNDRYRNLCPKLINLASRETDYE